MANRHRGEIEAEIGGRVRRLRLTLGALAELESAFAAEDLGDLARRFSTGRLKARDAIAVIAAGLRGAGEAVSEVEVAEMSAPGGAPAYADTVVRLMAATFGVEEAGDERGPFPAAGAPSPGTP